ncbi:G-type lectin S-receptor-like serine/threonine-protein kinase At2g19130 [Macadamia integrifolia]|uniref:G-type lectin S-receptor-like serine/threonine-protein kinase At2g19130 n=1 Tax=Macadamia integrifolia TaxID=60698 RepID=UPI001C4F22DE|nr:G-type lectin S-receptor-like serine/threonine-protein kinase At2g19130 [Macadamia integrifolia]
MGERNRELCFFCVLFLCFFFDASRPSVGARVLSVGESISVNQTIISQGDGNFELGFFMPLGYSQDYCFYDCYIGIWYRKIPERTVVWVANRDEHLSDEYSSELKLLEDGNLVILGPSKTIIWSTNLTPTTSNSTEAALLDSGNLVLRNVSNSSHLIWESFDHPTDTWLPGGKIGLNKFTNTSQRLISRKSDLWDPSPGIFSLELDPAGSNQLFILRNGSVTYRTNWTWSSHIFRLAPDMGSDYIYNFTYNFAYISNQKVNYVTYYLSNSSLISRFVLDDSGQIHLFTWLDSVGWTLFWGRSGETCAVFNLCGAFGICNQQAVSADCQCLKGFSPYYTTDYPSPTDWSAGCLRNIPLQCVDDSSVNGKKDGYFKMSKMKLPANPQSVAVGSSQDCEVACLNSCSCNAYAYDGNCSFWEGKLLNLEQLSNGCTGGQELYLKLAISELMSSTSGGTSEFTNSSSGGTSELTNSISGGNKKGSPVGAIAGAVSGVVALLGLLVVLMWTRQRRNLVGPSEAVEGYLVPFSYKDLKFATKSFSEKLGRGGFGSVFKGTLFQSTVVAVKKLEGLSQGEKQFRTEVSTIGMIQHVNLVRLRGFCCEGTKRLLVYDFMPKGSLDSHLFHKKNDSEVLDWKTRYQIALGTAKGLSYLHEKCRECIIHCDIKPENILLDAEFCPKVADFGLAKFLGRDFSRGVLTTMRGTIGYLAPEWISGVAITAKADVYSYGMMLFELISGRRNSDQSVSAKVGFFPIWAARKINEDGEILSLLDDRLEGNVDLAELHRACKVASWCIQDDEVYRPSMGLVVQILEGIVEVGTPPIPRRLEGLVANDFSEPFSNHILQVQSPTSGTSSEAMSTL